MKTRTLLICLAALLPTAAFAHVGAAGHDHASAFMAGLTHPFTGLDHLAAMLTVGIWSALAFGGPMSRALIAPAVFAMLVLVGAVAGFGGMPVRGVEPMIAASLLVLGILLAVRVKLPVAAGAVLVGAFALFHGVAHGQELPVGQTAAAMFGMLLGTLMLHVAGIAIGRFVLIRNVWLPRIAGAGVAVFGAGLLTGLAA